MILAEDLAIMDWNSNMRLAKSQGEAIGVARGMAQGVAQGVAQGEDKLAKLINQLLSLGRTDDVMKATNDVKAREQFYKEFGIIDPPAET